LYAYADFAESSEWLSIIGNPPDLLFTHYVFTAPLVERLPESCRTVHVATDIMAEQFSIGDGDVAPARKQFFRTLETRLYEMFDLNLFPSQHLYQRAKATFYQPTLRFVPAYLDYAQGHAAGAEEDLCYDLLFLGDDTPIHRQGLEWFYQHVYRLHLQPYGVRWAIAGPCASLSFQSRHLFALPTDNVLPTRPANLYQAAKLVVVPNLTDSGLPLAALHAMANECALVSTPAGVCGMASVEESVIKLDMKADP